VRDRLIGEGALDQAGYEALEKDVIAEVEDALKFAEESPDPDPSELWTDVYAPGGE
jgi:pyruvate dehydrogenase E1 component alpha subunit